MSRWDCRQTMARPVDSVEACVAVIPHHARSKSIGGARAAPRSAPAGRRKPAASSFGAISQVRLFQTCVKGQQRSVEAEGDLGRPSFERRAIRRQPLDEAANAPNRPGTDDRAALMIKGGHPADRGSNSAGKRHRRKACDGGWRGRHRSRKERTCAPGRPRRDTAAT